MRASRNQKGLIAGILEGKIVQIGNFEVSIYCEVGLEERRDGVVGWLTRIAALDDSKSKKIIKVTANESDFESGLNVEKYFFRQFQKMIYDLPLLLYPAFRFPCDFASKEQAEQYSLQISVLHGGGEKKDHHTIEGELLGFPATIKGTTKFLGSLYHVHPAILEYSFKQGFSGNR